MPEVCLSLKDNLTELQEIVEVINNLTAVNAHLKDWLTSLFRRLFSIAENVPSVFTLDVEEKIIYDHLKKVQGNIDTYYTLNKTIDDIEIALSRLLDLLDTSSGITGHDWTLESLVDLIEDCSNAAIELRVGLESRKSVVDAVLEYDEISVDQIETLESLIGKNIQTCFELQEVRFSSPVRHTPSFTLKELIRVLSSYNESSDLKIPTFSSLENSLCRRFLKLKDSILPIEKSLMEILPLRIDHFSSRTVTNIDKICTLMTARRVKLLPQFQLMVAEVDQLKVELIDKKWRIVFQNLIHELTFIFEELESLQKKMTEKKHEQDIQEKFRYQLKKKVRTITKTFSAIEKAVKLSLLDPDTMSKTEELSQKWNEMRPTSEQILAGVDHENKEYSESVVTKLKSLNVSSAIQPTEIPRNKFGSMLMKKMNIKPIMIAGSPASAEKVNPFYQTYRDSEKEGASEHLIMQSVPSLPYRSAGDSFMNDNNSNKQNYNSLKTLEAEKLTFYSQKRSKIPTFKVTTVLPATFLLTPPSKLSQKWDSYQGQGRSLRPPTPVSALLTSSVV
ncbi:hypothetical protein HG535_0G03120 [Zygotorulaspora mrakii]|uniref:Karyogamy protein KAR9 n=1 Tax=Zygotorulaspora mrakii TaxID=42260 RepID=A0A7H9B8V8_ZYGMR|nr:uncharacterized protein HG535_0G03120 [Zygotorulaspora mrakii]QLG74429.1 hypothetical protein HG535_0G03120 [Zygotorulaspora mrakii]